MKDLTHEHVMRGEGGHRFITPWEEAVGPYTKHLCSIRDHGEEIHQEEGESEEAWRERASRWLVARYPGIIEMRVQ